MKRAKNSDFYKEHNWPERLRALKVDDITWRSKWMSTPCPVLRTRGNSCVQIMGLTHSSFYVPSLLCRQLNRLPSAVSDITDVSPPKELTKDFVWTIADAWNYRDHPTPTLMTAAASTEEIASSSGP
ncbi:hypothetical protein NE237_011010 [Protea cynaroides]|uniref:Uncharacterized protein n=1 Tax=Protea cynaroides TaxID=273540 RepID=A0A9Q0JSI6_9MAGN|nr:hypothetical protein NE237_011010 [Protea cynaroides]